MIRPERLYTGGLPVRELTTAVKDAHFAYTISKLVYESVRVFEPTASVPSLESLGRRFLEDVFRLKGTDVDIELLIAAGAMDEEDWDIWDEIILQSVEDDFMSKPKNGEA